MGENTNNYWARMYLARLTVVQRQVGSSFKKHQLHNTSLEFFLASPHVRMPPKEEKPVFQ